jgi:hypothetical protein
MSQAAHAFVRRMVRPCSRPLKDPERPAWRRSATGQVTGTKFLKVSENYPPAFAAAMANAFLDRVVNAGPDFPLARLRQSPEEALRHLAHVQHKAFASHPAEEKDPNTYPNIWTGVPHLVQSLCADKSFSKLTLTLPRLYLNSVQDLYWFCT